MLCYVMLCYVMLLSRRYYTAHFVHALFNNWLIIRLSLIFLWKITLLADATKMDKSDMMPSNVELI